MKPELFFLPNGENDILYAPLRRFIAEVSSSVKNAVAAHMNGLALDESQNKVIGILKDKGVFDEAEPPKIEEEFCPTRVTLFPTDFCNLRCRYCYASAAEGGHRLPMNAARAAIDLISENAKKKGYSQFSLGFHGNGEPFMAQDIMQECCEYAAGIAEKNNVRCQFSTATNGVLSDSDLDFLLAWIADVNVSFDILPDIQNRQRPTAGGGGSFDRVSHTLSRLDAAGAQYGIRATITTESVTRLREMAAFAKEHYPKCNVLHMEPVFEVGRALLTGQSSPPSEIFVREFIKAQNELKGSGIRLVYSGARSNGLYASFCSVCRNGFTVTAEGNATSCYEVCTYQDPRAQRYIYGKYDEQSGKFLFDSEKMELLSKLNVSNFSYCEDCFCKWHCAGDCTAKTLGLGSLEQHAGSERCVITRALIYREVLERMGVDAGIEPVFI
ncbi:MAG: hypothetical protein LBU32_21090 [Clostridiales bacterium]|jgi:uncharacterized protein|nr:hypothetical protein [Clostridiales bacterium]